MNGATMWRRRRVGPKAPSISDTEYFSDSRAPEQPISTTGDGPSSPSERCYASGTDSAGGDSDSPSPSGSTLPPPSTAQFTGELKVPDDTDLSDNGKERAWYEFDLSVILALLSPILNWLTGSDYVKNILIALLIVFYLHQIIEGASSLFVFICRE